MKKWTKVRRTFLGPADCLGAVAWRVESHRHWNPEKDLWHASAEMNINDDAQHHFVNRKADMRPLYRMRDELNQFIELAERALQDAEDYNAKSKDST